MHKESCLTGIYRRWGKGGRKEPMKDMIRLAVRLISHGLS